MGPRTHLAARAGGQGAVGAARWGDRSFLDANPRKPPKLIYSVIAELYDIAVTALAAVEHIND
jgi:hypothetical protein